MDSTLKLEICMRHLKKYDKSLKNMGMDMSVLTVVEASKKFNIGRTAIYKAIKNGDITPQKNHDGVQVIDAQDMIRVFGSVRKPVSKSDHKSVLVSDINNDEIIRELREQIKELKSDKDFLKQEIASVRKDFDDYKLMITHKSSTEVDENLETVLQTEENSIPKQEKQEKKTLLNEVEKEPVSIREKQGFLKKLWNVIN